MASQLFTAVRLLAALTVLLGLAYPLLVTGVAQLLFARQATGSLIRDDQRVRGSELIGQSFHSPHYFWGRLSATEPMPYNASASSGSNFGPLNPQLRLVAQQRLTALESGGAARHEVPVDLVTASASGLDPHISPQAAQCQVPRVAAARRVSVDKVYELVRAHTEGRRFFLLGEPRINVLRLNLALDAQAPIAPRGS